MHDLQHIKLRNGEWIATHHAYPGNRHDDALMLIMDLNQGRFCEDRIHLAYWDYEHKRWQTKAGAIYDLDLVAHWKLLGELPEHGPTTNTTTTKSYPNNGPTNV